MDNISHTVTIANRRLNVPAGHFTDGESVVVALHPEGQLLVYRAAEWQSVYQKLMQLAQGTALGNILAHDSSIKLAVENQSLALDDILLKHTDFKTHARWVAQDQHYEVFPIQNECHG